MQCDDLAQAAIPAVVHYGGVACVFNQSIPAPEHDR